jgi:hypothetical protein
MLPFPLEVSYLVQIQEPVLLVKTAPIPHGGLFSKPRKFAVLSWIYIQVGGGFLQLPLGFRSTQAGTKGHEIIYWKLKFLGF